MGFNDPPGFQSVLNDGPPRIFVIAWILGLLLLLGCLVVFVLQVVHHVKKAREFIQEKETVMKLVKIIIQIIALVPVFGVTSYLGLVFLRADPVFHFLQLTYEAWALWSFYLYIITLLGGHHAAAEAIEGKIFRWSSCGMSTKMWMLKWGVFQNVFVKPTLGLLGLILIGADHYEEGTWDFQQGFPYLQILNIISTVVCVVCLFQLYFGSRDQLSHFSLGWKFFGIKFILLVNVVQTMILGYLVKKGRISSSGIYPASTKVDAIRDGLLLIEVFVIGIVFYFSFKVSDLDGVNSTNPLFDGIRVTNK